MVKVGEVYWIARVEGQSKASAAAENLQDEMSSVAEQSEKAAAAQNELGDELVDTSSGLSDASRESDRFDTSSTLLNSSLFFVAGKLGILNPLVKAYAVGATLAAGATSLWNLSLAGLLAIKAGLLGALGKAVALGGSFLSWLLAGSAGALAFAGAIGTGIGLLGVWILETLGALDAVGRFGSWIRDTFPDWVADGILMAISVFTTPMAALGGFIVGTIRGGFREGFETAREVVETFIGAWDRNLSRAGELFAGLRSSIVDRITEAMGSVKSRVREGFDAAGARVGEWVSSWGNRLSDARERFSQFKQNVVQGFTDMFNQGRDFASSLPGILSDKTRAGFNAVVPDSVSIPSVTLEAPDWAGGMSKTIGGQTLNLPQLDVGGRIDESGVAEVHKGEAVIPKPIVEAAEQNEGSDFSPPAGQQETSGQMTINVEIGDQSLDLSSLDRTTVRTLADQIGNEIGSSSMNRAGGD